MDRLFDDIILRKEEKQRDLKVKKEREKKVLHSFGNYCEKHIEELKELFEVVNLDNKESSWKSDPWDFCLEVYQKKSEHGYYISVTSNEIEVSSFVCGEYNKKFKFNYKMNNVQLIKIMRNALRCLVSKAYCLSKKNRKEED